MRERRGLPELPLPPVPGKEVPAHEPEFPPDLYQQGAYAEALRGMADRPFLASATYKAQQERANRVGAHPDLLEFERLFIKRMKALGVPMFAFEVLRTPERQDALQGMGFSKVKADKAAHPRGCAVDIVHSGKAWALTDRQWLIVGHVGKELAKAKGIKITWGGDWKPNANGVGWDPAHWEITGYLTLVPTSELDQFPWPEIKPWVASWRKLLKPKTD